MSERVVVRRATLQDVGEFQRLWLAFLVDQHDKGDLTLPNEHNMAHYTNMFHYYVSGDLLGVVWFVNVNGRDVGVHMEGEIPGGLELSIGKYTMLWGVYLEPEFQGKRYTHGLYEKAMEWTYKMGLTGGITGMLTTNASVSEVLAKVVDGKIGATGTKPYSVCLYWEFDQARAS